MRFCTSCGRPGDGDVRICTGCGSPVTEIATAPTGTLPPPAQAHSLPGPSGPPASGPPAGSLGPSAGAAGPSAGVSGPAQTAGPHASLRTFGLPAPARKADLPYGVRGRAGGGPPWPQADPPASVHRTGTELGTGAGPGSRDAPGRHGPGNILPGPLG